MTEMKSLFGYFDWKLRPQQKNYFHRNFSLKIWTNLILKGMKKNKILPFMCDEYIDK